LSVLVLLAAAALGAADRPVVVLWPAGAPGSEGATGEETVRVTEGGDHVFSNIHHPSLTVYLPQTAAPNGAAVLVIPGGGHREIWIDHEGHAIAQWLCDRGIAAFVLKYRLARQEGSAYTIESHELADAQRALRTIRHRAAEWRIDPARLGVMGFSAGGQLASMTATSDGAPIASASDPIDRQRARPAFQALIYPGNTAGILPSKDNPPAFLLCGENDRPDISNGLAAAYVRFRDAGVSAELHVIAGAGHGFGLRASNRGATATWIERFHEWLDGGGFLEARTAP
jgi:endo-1,4-beta-xylanase